MIAVGMADQAPDNFAQIVVQGFLNFLKTDTGFNDQAFDIRFDEIAVAC
jgi:hypothetical protein